jgi:hypothetical protein
MVRFSEEVNMPWRWKLRGGVGLLALWLGGGLFPTGLDTRARAQAPSPSGIKIVLVEGEGAINNIRERRAKEPVVHVLDDDNRPIAGASVTFQVPELGASATFPTGVTLTVTTDQKGEAAGKGLRPNNIAGQFQIRVTASYRGQTARAVITQTNAAPVAARGGSSKKVAIALILGGGAAAGAAFALARGKTEGATPAQPAKPPATATTITPGTGGFGPP